MKIIMKIVKGFGWRAAVTVSMVAWALFSWSLWTREGISPLYCLILGAMVLALVLPIGLESLQPKKWFYLAMSMWCLVILPTGLVAFNVSVARTVFPQRFYIPLAVFGCVSMLAIWALKTGDNRRAPRRPEPRETSS